MSKVSEGTFYQVLNVEQTATQREITAAYRKLILKHHPDKGGSKEEFQKIDYAYRVLSDPDRRASHDSSLNIARAKAMQMAHSKAYSVNVPVSSPVTVEKRYYEGNPAASNAKKAEEEKQAKAAREAREVKIKEREIKRQAKNKAKLEQVEAKRSTKSVRGEARRAKASSDPAIAALQSERKARAELIKAARKIVADTSLDRSVPGTPRPKSPDKRSR